MQTRQVFLNNGFRVSRAERIRTYSLIMYYATVFIEQVNTRGLACIHVIYFIVYRVDQQRYVFVQQIFVSTRRITISLRLRRWLYDIYLRPCTRALE